MGYANIQTRKLPFVLRYAVDLIAYRHLCWNLVASDLRSRFRRSSIGILWAVIQPLAFALMIAAVWGTVMGTVNYWDYALYVFSGLLVWEYFATVVNVSQDSLTTAEGYLKQTRIPFLAFQVRTPLTSMVIFGCGLCGLLILMLALGKLPPVGQHMLLLPAFAGLLLMFGIPLAILMSVMGTMYRDIKYISQIGLQGLFFLSPVMLGREVFERPELKILEFLNPAVALLDLFRAPIIDGALWDQQALTSLLVWIGALWVFAIFASAKVGRRIIFAL